MFCTIQEVEVKKQDKDGYPKMLESKYMKSSLLGSHYYYSYSFERFERPIKKAYRIGMHKSYRQDGKVYKKQYSICTVRYYDLATDHFTLYDWGNPAIEKAAEELGITADVIYDLIEEKLNPLIEQVQQEFQETEEFKTHEEHKRITTIYAARKAEFNEKYGLSGNEYDRCYDVFGNLRCPEQLERIKEEYEKKSRSYYEDFYSNYNQGSYSSYANTISSNYSEEEQGILKQFYRELSKKFHPDSNPEKDTSKQMQLLNKLKKDWDL